MSQPTHTLENAIKFGAVFQREFDMLPDFKIEFFPSDIGQIVRVLVPQPSSMQRIGASFPSLSLFDEVHLIEIANNGNLEYMRAGYSKAANTLCLVV